MPVMTFEWMPTGLGNGEPDNDLASASARLPSGAYTTLRTYSGRRLLRLDDHAARLSASANAPLDPATLRAAVRAALRAGGHPESRLRVTFAPPRLWVSVEAFAPPAPALYTEGVRCVTLPVHRQRPEAKDTRFIATAEAAYRTLPAGVHEGLLVSEGGEILEGLSSNFFAVHAGALRTEMERALPGITRALVLEVSRDLLPLLPQPVHTDELGAVSECFITSTSRGVLPVVMVDGHTIGPGRPGPLTAEIGRRFDRRIAEESEEA
jgi:branched-chain amino acid aminotransferase